MNERSSNKYPNAISIIYDIYYTLLFLTILSIHLSNEYNLLRLNKSLQ